jgi:hypothetical protein
MAPALAPLTVSISIGSSSSRSSTPQVKAAKVPPPCSASESFRGGHGVERACSTGAVAVTTSTGAGAAGAGSGDGASDQTLVIESSRLAAVLEAPCEPDPSCVPTIFSLILSTA